MPLMSSSGPRWTLPRRRRTPCSVSEAPAPGRGGGKADDTTHVVQYIPQAFLLVSRDPETRELRRNPCLGVGGEPLEATN